MSTTIQTAAAIAALPECVRKYAADAFDVLREDTEDAIETTVEDVIDCLDDQIGALSGVDSTGAKLRIKGNRAAREMLALGVDQWISMVVGA